MSEIDAIRVLLTAKPRPVKSDRRRRCSMTQCALRA
jgi:hypothetical protein